MKWNQNKDFIMLLLAVLGACVLIVALGIKDIQSGTGEVRCTGLTIVDKSGKERAKIFVDGDLVGMEMVDENGNKRVIVGAYSNTGDVQSIIGLYGQDKKAKVIIMDYSRFGAIGIIGYDYANPKQIGINPDIERLNLTPFRWPK